MRGRPRPGSRQSRRREGAEPSQAVGAATVRSSRGPRDHRSQRACLRATPAGSLFVRPMYTVTVRSSAKVRKQRHEQLDDALAAVERVGRELADGTSERPVGGTLIRRLEPVQQVVGRIELTGPGRMRAGVDVRGDGSSEAYTGRLRRMLVEQRGDESAYEALRRAVS